MITTMMRTANVANSATSFLCRPVKSRRSRSFAFRFGYVSRQGFILASCIQIAGKRFALQLFVGDLLFELGDAAIPFTKKLPQVLILSTELRFGLLVTGV